MSVWGYLLTFLAEHGPRLLAGATALLAFGCLASRLVRTPIQRQRTAEAAVLAFLAWVVLFLLPLPRLSWSGNTTAGTARRESSPTIVDPTPKPEWTKVSPSDAAPATPPPGRELPAEDAVALQAIVEELASQPSRPEAASRLPALRSEVAAPVTEHATRSFDVPRGIAAAYLIGLAGCIGWILLGRVLLARAVGTASQPPEWLAAVFREVSGGPGCRLLVAARTVRPMAFGLLRPTILLPVPLCRPENADLLRHVLGHEWAHVRQRDAWGQTLLNLALPLLYFHPLYWWLRGEVHRAAELVADDLAAAPCQRQAYVAALVQMARQRAGHRLLAWNTHGMSGSPSHFFRRMQMLLARSTNLASRCSWRFRLGCFALGGLAVALLAATMGATPAPAQDRSADPLGALDVAGKPQPADAKKELDAIKHERDTLLKAKAASDKQIADLQAALVKVEKQLGELQAGRAFNAPAPKPAGTPGTPHSNNPYDYSPPVPGSRHTPAAAPSPYSSPASTSPVPSRYLAPAATNIPGHDPNVGQQIDLVNLANSLSDAVDKLTLARMENGRYQELRKMNSVSESEVQACGIRMSGAKRRLELLKAIAESSLRATAVEAEALRDQLKSAQGQFNVGGISATDLGDFKVRAARADGRLDVLKRILDSAKEDSSGVPANPTGTPSKPASDSPAPLDTPVPGPR